MNIELQKFVSEAIGRRIPRNEIRQALLNAKWQEEEIDSTLGLYADVDFPVPVPTRKPYLSARDTFIYLVLYMCLYISAFSLGALLFDFINRGFPDPLLDYGYDDGSGLKMSVASLIVAFPVFYGLTSMMRSAMAKDAEKRSSKIRKWLTYLTEFVTASVIIGDLISLIYNLLGGETTTRFILKSLVILGIAGLIFGYYIWDLKKEERQA